VALTPSPIKTGSILSAISPAGPVGSSEVERGIDALRELGLSVRVGEHALDDTGYLAGNDNDRSEDLHNAFLDPETDGVICTRGGYGTMRLLPLIDWELIAGSLKPFIGFSDITALQLAMWQKLQWVTFSGPQLARGFGGLADDFSREQWKMMVHGESWGRPLPLLGGGSLKRVSPGTAEGTLLGGNLAILSALCGTEYAPQFTDSIVILEEIDEPPYRIDRMLTQLLLAGAFDGVRGILLGGFWQHVKGERLDHTKVIANILKSALPDIPIISDAPYGHVGSCWTLPIGGWATLNAENGTLTMEPGR